MSPLLLCLFTPPPLHLPRLLQASCLVEVVGSRLQFVTAIQLRLIVIAADGLEPGPSLGPGGPKHFSLILSLFFPLWLSDCVLRSLDLDLFLGCPYLSFVTAFAFFPCVVSQRLFPRVQITGEGSEKAHLCHIV